MFIDLYDSFIEETRKRKKQNKVLIQIHRLYNIQLSKGKPLDRTPKGVHPRREIVLLFFYPNIKKAIKTFIIHV